MKNKRRGLTLTEVSIVMMIVGMILSAIWVATRAVYLNARVSDTTKQLGMIAAKARSMYGVGGATPVDATINGTNGAALFAQASIIPPEMVDFTVNPPHVTHAWHDTVTVDRAGTNVMGDSFRISLLAVPSDGCVALLMRMTGAALDPLMSFAGTDAVQYDLTNFPLQLSEATGACAGETNTVSFTYSVKR